MRRKDREIKSRESIDQIIAGAEVCRLGLCQDNRPYVVPVSFGYDGDNIYFHTAKKGMKIDYMTVNARVCFEMEQDAKVIGNEELACEWSHSFYSVIGFGTVHEITGTENKITALNIIMQHYSGKEWDFDGRMLKLARLWCISIEQVTGKHSKD